MSGTQRPRKRILNESRRRQLPRSFSWIDRRFLRDGWIDRLRREEILLYFFLVAVADKDGLSYYSLARTSALLKLPGEEIEKCRERLVEVGLIAYEAPLYQVLSLDRVARRGGDGAKVIGEVLREVLSRREDRKG